MAEPTIALFADDLIFRQDFASATIIYLGYASPGSATTDAVWQIREETLDISGRIVSILFANGNANLANRWSERATLTYR